MKDAAERVTLNGAELGLPPLPAGWQLVTVAVLASGGLALLATDIDLVTEWCRGPDGLVFGDARAAAAGATGRLWGWDGVNLVDGPSFPMETPFPKVDRFADGRWLVVASRSDGEPNARVLAPDGRLLARFTLGDGIAHVGVDLRDRIWVGWFDEGIFGNEAWRLPGEEWPPSRLGIGLFSAEGGHQPLAAFSEGAGDIADCYALNVTDDGAWAYLDFPLLWLRPGRPLRWWKNGIAGAGALAVSDGHALLAGGYGPDANRLALAALDGEGNGEVARVVATWRLPFPARWPRADIPPDGAGATPLPELMRLADRGDAIHLVQAGRYDARFRRS